MWLMFLFFFSSRRRHTICALVTGVQTCALPILANAGIQARRMDAAGVHDWLLRWFNPRPTLLGPGVEDRERFYALARYPDETEEGEIEQIGRASCRERVCQYV